MKTFFLFITQHVSAQFRFLWFSQSVAFNFFFHITLRSDLYINLKKFYFIFTRLLYSVIKLDKT